MSLGERSSIGDIVRQALAMPTVNDRRRLTGQAQRLRTVTPPRLFLAIVSALAARRVETLADLLRVFNHQQGVRVACKAFYNRLARPGFEAFMRALKDVFPGRLTTTGPAAVERHATDSGYAADVTAIHLAPDGGAERQFLPEPRSLTGCRFLADRGYPSVPYKTSECHPGPGASAGRV